jgi:hypothetical protein
MPVSAREWRQPSQRQAVFGIENQTRFRLIAKLDDGHIVWKGWFDDRDDADAFLFALFTGSLHTQPALWDLPTPNWYPGLGESVGYEFAAYTFLTTPTGSNQTYTVPSDFTTLGNSVECLGGGCGGGNSTGVGNGGGGGGAWAKATALALTIGGSATYQIGAGTTAENIVTPGDTWFNAATFAASSVGAKGASTGLTPAGSVGGLASACIGGSGGGTLNPGSSFSSNGGTGGSQTGSSSGGAGGAGAGGSSGAGVNGVSTANTLGANGGAGDNSIGGAGGTAPGGAGGVGKEWDSTHGSGGGGAGGNNGGGGATGGNWGSGGGGAGQINSPGAGVQGLIVIKYVPTFFEMASQDQIGDITRPIKVIGY